MTSEEEIQWLRDRLAAERRANTDLRQENARLEAIITELHSGHQRFAQRNWSNECRR